MRRALTRLGRKSWRAIRHLFLDQTYARYYNAATWERDYRDGYDLSQAAEAARYAVLISLIQRFDASGPILDAGCGDGLLEARYRPVSPAAMVGVDYSATAIERARACAMPNCVFRCEDFRSMRSSERFAVAVFNESLYYAEDYLGTLDEAGRRLMPGGVLVVSMFRTLVTARMWRRIRRHHEVVHHVTVGDGESGLKWDLAVLRPPSGPSV